MAQPFVERPAYRPSVVGPFVLISAGILLLLNNLGYLSWDVWWHLLRFWPILIVLAGLQIVLRRVSSPLIAALAPLLVVAATFGAAICLTWMQTGGVAASDRGLGNYLDQPLGAVERASLELNFGAGRLTLSSLGVEDGVLAEASSAGGTNLPVRKSYYESNGVGRLSFSSDTSRIGLFWGERPPQWDIRVTRGVPLDISLKSGVTDASIDLTDLRVTNLSIQTGASRTEVRFPAATGTTEAKINAGVADLTLVIPAGVAARVKVPNALIGADVDRARFTEEGGVYSSGDWTRSDNRLNAVVEGALARVALR